MATIQWPRAVLTPKRSAFNIAPRSLAGPSSVSGVGQVVASDAGIWKATYSDIVIRRGSQAVIAFRAVANLLEGRLNPILVSMCSAYQPKQSEWVGSYKLVPHSDKSPFDDGGLYRNKVTHVTLGSNVPVRGTTLSLNIVIADRIQPGQYFSVGERLYLIRTVNYTAANAATITFRPPAREAMAIGQMVEFDRPVCRMRLMTDSEMDLELDLAPWTFPTVNFIEDV